MKTQTSRLLMTVTILAVLSGVAAAQEQPDFPGPEKEHQWLKKFVGQWTTTSKGSMGPDQPPMECSGTVEGRMIGELWIVNEMQSTPQGIPMQGLQTIGYDPAKKKYVGTWIDSMLHHMWQYEGTVDKSGTKLTLEAEGPNFMSEGKLTKFRDAYEFKTPNLIIVTSSMLGDDGQWVTFMTGECQRKTTAAE
ncbi:MAG: DUF1579 domain-containing protein [Pirellulaceae bacterium]|nr:DUF1579 domain-containing protein [Planctomycetales bacterium]